MSNSSLASAHIWSPNYTTVANKKNTDIVLHHMAGNMTVESCGYMFANPARGASSQYGIGTDGRIGQYVDEMHRAWTTGDYYIDARAVTIEVANNSGAPQWTVSDAALNSAIKLIADICKRNGIKKLNYTGNKSGNLHMHQWYQNTNCPGPYLGSKFTYIANEVNKILGSGGTVTPPVVTPPSTGKEKYGIGTPFTSTGLWTQANGGRWVPRAQLSVKEYTIGSPIHTGAEHPYRAVSNGTVIGFANDKVIDDEPSIPGGGTSSGGTTTSNNVAKWSGTPTADQVLGAGSKCQIRKVLKISQVDNKNNLIAIHELTPPPLAAYNWIDPTPFIKTDAKGNRLANQVFSVGDYGVLPNTYSALAIDAPTNAVYLPIGNRKTWIKAGLVTEIK